MMTQVNKISVYIITGFLGAGKTTFVNHFIKSQPNKRILVIENEVGKANIDGALIIQSAVDVKELTAGCLCCDLNEKLYDLLYDLAQRRDEFDMIVIETTGIADPSSVAETIWTGGFMDKTYDLKATICVADAQNMEEALGTSEDARRQLTFSDIILLNKCENQDNESIHRLKNLIHNIHPGTPIIHGNEGIFPITEIHQISNQKTNHLNSSIPNQNYKHKHLGINTFTLSYDQPFDYRQLRHTLMLLLNINKHQIYRIKGILNVPDMDNKVILQSVFKTFRMEEGSPWLAEEKRVSTIVFIGREVEKESMERVFKQCLVKSDY
jgi:G3E family GTPase